MGKVKKQRNSTRNRKDPLLPTTNTGIQENARCGACSRLILLLVPILGCTFILGSLCLLVYRLEVSISDTSISRCLADYSPKVEVLVLLFIGATLIFIVTAMRNVQINVYHRRQKSESRFMRVLNNIATIANIVAYVGFVILALFDTDGPGQAPLIHDIGAYMYFGLSGLYQVLHIFLLCKQSHYPMFCKIIFTIVSIATIACSIIFAVNPEEKTEFEWFSVALAAMHVGLISILFLVDSVDDELRDFFCCRRVSSDQTSQSSRSKSVMMT